MTKKYLLRNEEVGRIEGLLLVGSLCLGSDRLAFSPINGPKSLTKYSIETRRIQRAASRQTRIMNAVTLSVCSSAETIQQSALNRVPPRQITKGC